MADMACKECGAGNPSPVFFDMIPVLVAFYDGAPPTLDPFQVFWACRECDRIHHKNGDLYYPKNAIDAALREAGEKTE